MQLAATSSREVNWFDGHFKIHFIMVLPGSLRYIVSLIFVDEVLGKSKLCISELDCNLFVSVLCHFMYPYNKCNVKLIYLLLQEMCFCYKEQ